MSRERILADVRAALVRRSPPAIDHPHPAWPRSAAVPPADVIERFRRRFEGLGGHWHEGAPAEVASRLAGPGATVLVARDPDGLLDRLGLAEALAAQGHPVVRVADAAVADRIGLTITAATLAIADSGTVGMVTDPGQGRLASVISPLHLTVLTRDRVAESLGDFLGLARSALAAGRASAAILITGPSRTADIEGQLIVGVHGPKAVHCLLVGEG